MDGFKEEGGEKRRDVRATGGAEWGRAEADRQRGKSAEEEEEAGRHGRRHLIDDYLLALLFDNL